MKEEIKVKSVFVIGYFLKYASHFQYSSLEIIKSHLRKIENYLPREEQIMPNKEKLDKLNVLLNPAIRQLHQSKLEYAQQTFKRVVNGKEIPIQQMDANFYAVQLLFFQFAVLLDMYLVCLYGDNILPTTPKSKIVQREAKSLASYCQSLLLGATKNGEKADTFEKAENITFSEIALLIDHAYKTDAESIDLEIV